MPSQPAFLDARLRGLTGVANLGTLLGDDTTLLRELYDKLQILLCRNEPDCIVDSETGLGSGLTVDNANAENAETTLWVEIRKNGVVYRIAAITELDISALSAGGGTDTISTSKYGVIWFFVNTAGAGDAETPIATQAYNTAVEALAHYADIARLPPGTDDVCIGCAQVLEGGSGAWTVGVDSITGETETWRPLQSGLPGVEAALASFALDTAAATYNYGAGKVRLGTGVRISLSGEASAVTVTGSNVATGATGAWIVYALADDQVFALQIGAAYATLVAARTAVREAKINPMLPAIGAIFVVNTSGSNFVPGTTNLDAAGIAATFTIFGPGANAAALGEDAAGQPILGLTSTKPTALV